MITPEQMSRYQIIGDSKNVLPPARQAIRDLSEEVQRIHGIAVAQAAEIRSLRAELLLSAGTP